MRRADKRTLAACVLALAAAAVLPFAAHPAWTLAVLFLTPVLAECLRACGMKGQGMAIAAVMCLCAWLAGHPQQVSQLACLWCLAAMLTDRLPVFINHRRRVKGWAVFTAAILCAAVVMLRGHYEGQVTQGLAEDISAWFGNLKDSNRILLALYQMGYARLEGEMAQTPAIQLFGTIVMNPETKTELVNSLRTTLRYQFNEQLPGWLTVYLMITVLLTAVLPEEIRRRRGETTEIAPVQSLYISRQRAIGACVLMLFGFTRFLTGSMAVYQAAGMAMTAFSVMYCAQGVCLIIWWMRHGQYRRGGWLMTAVLLLLMLPAVGTILMLLGVADQFADPRRLREKDIEGGT